MEAAQLTAMAGITSLQKGNQQRDPLDRALDGVQSGGLSGGLSSGGLSGQKGSAAYPVLCRVLVDQPERLSSVILDLMREANRSSAITSDGTAPPDPCSGWNTEAR